MQVQNRACSTPAVFTDSDWAGDRPAQVRVFVGDHAGWILDQCRCPNTVSHEKLSAFAATAFTSEAKYTEALFLACGQHTTIHLRSDSTGAIGVASRRGLQRFRHLDVRFLWLQGETANKNIRISKVPGPENVVDANTKLADKRSLVFCRSKMGVTEIQKQFRDALL